MAPARQCQQRGQSAQHDEKLHRLDPQVEAENRGDAGCRTQSEVGDQRREGEAVDEPEAERHQRLAPRKQRPRRVDRRDQHGQRDASLNGGGRQVGAEQRGGDQRQAVPHGERGNDHREMAEGGARFAQGGPAAARGQQRRGQQQGQQEHQVVIAFGDMSRAQAEAVGEQAGHAGMTAIDRENRPRCGKRADEFALAPRAAGQVSADHQQREVGWDLPRDDAPVEAETAVAGAGRGQQRGRDMEVGRADDRLERDPVDFDAPVPPVRRDHREVAQQIGARGGKACRPVVGGKAGGIAELALRHDDIGHDRAGGEIEADFRIGCEMRRGRRGQGEQKQQDGQRGDESRRQPAFSHARTRRTARRDQRLWD